MNPEQLVQYVAHAAGEKKALGLTILDIRSLSTLTDYFVICHGRAEKQVQSIARGIADAVEMMGAPVGRLEGYASARWILIDLGDVVVHVFHQEDRSVYDLERLWGDAEKVQVQEA